MHLTAIVAKAFPVADIMIINTEESINGISAQKGEEEQILEGRMEGKDLL